MASSFETKPPVGFWVAAVALFLWDVMGCWSWWEHITKGPAQMGQVPTQYDVQYYAALPSWYAGLYAAAVFIALVGGMLLLLRKKEARLMYILSLIATVAMFGYTFLATDLVQVKGVATAYFPVFIILLGFVSVWFAGLATKRGWLR